MTVSLLKNTQHLILETSSRSRDTLSKLKQPQETSTPKIHILLVILTCISSQFLSIWYWMELLSIRKAYSPSLKEIWKIRNTKIENKSPFNHPFYTHVVTLGENLWILLRLHEGVHP